MGCDIHLYVEVKRNNKWVFETGFKSDMYTEGHQYFGSDKFLNYDTPYTSRNYRLFAFLANVRNGIGFAGINTGTRVKPLSNPKGLPDDVSSEIADEYYSWGCDAHSASHFTLKELLHSDNQTFENYRYMDYHNYLQYKNNLSHFSSSDVSGEKVMKVNEHELEQATKDNPDKKVYGLIKSKHTIRDYCTTFFNKTIPQLINRSEDGLGEDVRIVFWFDN